MKKILPLYALVFCCLFASCKKDDDTQPQSNLITSSNELSSLLTFTPDTKRKQGNFPDPVGSTLTLSGALSSTKIARGYSSTIQSYYNRDNDKVVVGYYLKVDGADDYFDIPITEGGRLGKLKSPYDDFFKMRNQAFENKGGRVSNTGGNLILPITVPATVEDSSFCLSYCVYDNTGNISNTVNLCIEVLSKGSGESAFFLQDNSWKLIKTEVYDDSTNLLISEYIIGNTDTLYYKCLVEDTLTGTQEQDSLMISYRKEYDELTFVTNGRLERRVKQDSYTMFSSGFSSDDGRYFYSYCDETTITHHPAVDLNMEGVWSYNNATESLTTWYNNSNYSTVEVEIEANEQMILKSKVMMFRDPYNFGRRYKGYTISRYNKM